MIYNLLESLLKIRISESSIDFPRDDLDLSVWNKDGDKYQTKPEVKQQILDILSKYPDDLVKIAKDQKGVIKIIGSMCTNQYQDISDFDIHITIPESSDLYGDKKFQDEVEDWFDDNREDINAYIGEHPVTVYIQFDPEHEEELADGLYDLMADEWIKGPKFVPMDYDPYDDFSEVFKDLEGFVEDADDLFGELRRDIIDYEIIQKAINHLSGDQRSALYDKIQAKLKEIESDINDLYGERKKWTDARKEASKAATAKNGKWDNANAMFKFVARYQYLKVIKDLKKILDKDSEIDNADVEDVKSTLDKQTNVGPVV